MGFEFPERLAQLLLDAIDLMEESAAVDLHLAAAEFPVRSEKEVIFEELVLPFRKGPAAHQTKVGDKFLIFQAPYRFPLASRVGLE